MIKSDNTPYNLKVSFNDNGIERVKYTDDSKYWGEMVARHGHLSSLSVEPLVLTGDQQQRLDSLPAGVENPSLYVEYGTDEPDTANYDAEAYRRAQQAQVEPQVKAQRKRAEADGVVVNGIRHAGDPSNRQALSEALQAAKDSDQTTFARWKTADGFKANVPATDIEAAYRQIGKRRAALIDLEAQHVESVAAGEADIYELDWSTPHD